MAAVPRRSAAATRSSALKVPATAELAPPAPSRPAATTTRALRAISAPRAPRAPAAALRRSVAKTILHSTAPPVQAVAARAAPAPTRSAVSTSTLTHFVSSATHVRQETIAAVMAPPPRVHAGSSAARARQPVRRPARTAGSVRRSMERLRAHCVRRAAAALTATSSRAPPARSRTRRERRAASRVTLRISAKRITRKSARAPAPAPLATSVPLARKTPSGARPARTALPELLFPPFAFHASPAITSPIRTIRRRRAVPPARWTHFRAELTRRSARDARVSRARAVAPARAVAARLPGIVVPATLADSHTAVGAPTAWRGASPTRRMRTCAKIAPPAATSQMRARHSVSRTPCAWQASA